MGVAGRPYSFTITPGSLYEAAGRFLGGADGVGTVREDLRAPA